MKTLIKTEHTCENCRTKFQAATLGDFSYGEFLLWSSTENCLYLNAFEDDAYKEVINIIEENNHADFIQTSDTSLLLQEIYGELACDADSLGRLYRIGNPPCPSCGSTDMSSVGDHKVGQVAVKGVTHKIWNSLTLREKEVRLINILDTKN